MDNSALKGRALAALTVALGLLVIDLLLIRSGRVPVLLILLTLILGGYGLKTLYKLKKNEPRS